MFAMSSYTNINELKNNNIWSTFKKYACSFIVIHYHSPRQCRLGDDVQSSCGSTKQCPLLFKTGVDKHLVAFRAAVQSHIHR